MSVTLTLGAEFTLLVFLLVASSVLEKKLLQKMATVIFVIYIFVVLYITLLGRTGNQELHISLVPFWSYWVMLRGVFHALCQCDWRGVIQEVKFISYPAWSSLVLNILLFVPLGLLLPIVKESFGSLKKVFISGFLFSLSIEVTQILTKRGWFDVDDVINNTLGAVIGVILYLRIIDVRCEKINVHNA